MGRLHRTRATHTQRQQWLARSPPLPPPPPSSALAHMRVVQALCLHAACGAHTVVSRALDSSPCAADVAALARDTSMRRATISRSRLRQHSHPPNARRARRAHRSSSAATDAVARSPTVSRSPCAASAAAAADLAAAMSRRSAASAARQAEWSAAATSAASSPARICRYGASVTERQGRRRAFAHAHIRQRALQARLLPLNVHDSALCRLRMRRATPDKPCSHMRPGTCTTRKKRVANLFGAFSSVVCRSQRRSVFAPQNLWRCCSPTAGAQGRAQSAPQCAPLGRLQPCATTTRAGVSHSPTMHTGRRAR